MSLIKYGNSFLKLGNSLLKFDASRIPEPEPDPNMIGGRVYKVVEMPDGNTWLAENLDYKFEVDGSQIPIGVSGTPSTPAAWYYDNDEATYGIDSERKCGLLYNWYAVKYLNDNKDTLIPGWHVPSTTEWDALAIAVGGSSTAGTKLKASNVSWASSWGGTDDYQFGALPSGSYNGSFYYLGSYAYLFTSIDLNSIHAYSQSLYTGTSLSQVAVTKTFGLSVRLVKDK